MSQIPNVVRDIVTILNEALALDKQAITDLVAFHAVCNEEIANHSTITVSSVNKKNSVGILGIANGIAGKYGCVIMACYDDVNGDLISFETVSTDNFIPLKKT